MKAWIAKIANGVLVSFAAGIVVADSAYYVHRPEVPAELKK
jgi:cyclic lactone autoinducer peptide